jgi:D-serine deaminase-like pyridoxal phosphate-dependent protein
MLPDPTLDGTVKGWPDLGCRVSDVAGLGLHVDDLGTPALLLHESALAGNVAAMADWCAGRGVVLSPHVKTTMAPRLMERQLAAGAWALTVANVRQARVALEAGARRVVIANEVPAAGDLAWICAQDGEAEILFCVDSLAGVARADAAHGAAGGPPLQVLLEAGYDDGRCGVRSAAEALEVAGAIAASRHLTLRGVEGFEGQAEAPRAVLEDMAAAATAVASLVEAEPILTAGGSSFFDLVLDVFGPVAEQLGWTLCLRSGCYVTHDHGRYAEAAARWGPDAPRFEAALELRASVLSRPQPDRLILDVGRRDVSFDAGLPVVLDRGDLTVVALSDQHAHVRADGTGDDAVGDVVRLGISHPCTTFDRWSVIALADDDGRVLEGVTTCF